MTPDHKHYVRCLEALKESPIFSVLKTDQLHMVMRMMHREKWAAGLFKNSLELPTTLHFIISGRLKVYQINPKSGREHTIFILSKGDLFDIFNLLDTEGHEVYWECLDDLELLNFSNHAMKELITKQAELNASIFKYLGKRMRMLEDTAVDACIHDTLTRLTNLLLKNINGKSQKLELINNLPNDEIASLIGTTRAVVNRHIQELKRVGAISVKRKQIEIENIQLLLKRSQEKYPNFKANNNF